MFHSFQIFNESFLVNILKCGELKKKKDKITSIKTQTCHPRIQGLSSNPLLYSVSVLSFLFPLPQLSQPACPSLHTANSCFCASAQLILLLRCFSLHDSMSIAAVAVWPHIHLPQGAYGQRPHSLCPAHMCMAYVTGEGTSPWCLLKLPLLRPLLADLEHNRQEMKQPSLTRSITKPFRNMSLYQRFHFCICGLRVRR